jgi:hypothetical protein
MKYIITEKQNFKLQILRKLDESESEQPKLNNKKILFQELINEVLEYVIEGCDKSYDEFPGDISFDACEYTDVIKDITILDLIKNNDGTFTANVRVAYDSIIYCDYTLLLFTMERIIMEKTGGIRLHIYNEESINLHRGYQW